MPEIVLLASHHDRFAFDCGVSELNGFLKRTARQHGDKGISRTFVLAEPEKPSTIIGYFTLTLCEVRAESLPSAYAKKYPQHGLPAVRLARLAIAQKYQKQRYGSLLLAEAIHRTVIVGEQAGMIGLFVDAIDEDARKFYERYGFILLPGSEQQLFLPLETLRLLV